MTGKIWSSRKTLYLYKRMRQSDCINQWSRWLTSSFPHKYFTLTGFHAYFDLYYIHSRDHYGLSLHIAKQCKILACLQVLIKLAMYILKESLCKLLLWKRAWLTKMRTLKFVSDSTLNNEKVIFPILFLWDSLWKIRFWKFL